MARIFYTERDIEDLAARGVTELEINDNVYVTDLALEKMDTLGIKRKIMTRASAQSPSTVNSFTNAPQAAAPRASTQTPLSPAERQEVIEKVKSGVIARLGPGVDGTIVDAIVRRVVNQL